VKPVPARIRVGCAICCLVAAVLVFGGVGEQAAAQEGTATPPPGTMPSSGLRFPALFGQGAGPGEEAARPGPSGEPVPPGAGQSSFGGGLDALAEGPWHGWSQRPFGFNWLAGVVEGSPLIDDWVGMKVGFLGGFGLNWDATNSFGLETRFAFASLALYDGELARLAAEKAGKDPLLSPSRYGELFQWDIDFVYYTCGDRPLRPYLFCGLGLTSVHFSDLLEQGYYRAAPSFPVGLGLKYLQTDWLAFRIECADDIALGGQGIDTMHNLTLTAGAELRFGGPHHAYWPWNPGRHYW